MVTARGCLARWVSAYRALVAHGGRYPGRHPSRKGLDMTGSTRTIGGVAYQRVRANGSTVGHLAAEGAHFTLCGRQALYQFRLQQPKADCRRCAYEGHQRATRAREAGG